MYIFIFFSLIRNKNAFLLCFSRVFYSFSLKKRKKENKKRERRKGKKTLCTRLFSCSFQPQVYHHSEKYFLKLKSLTKCKWLPWTLDEILLLWEKYANFSNNSREKKNEKKSQYFFNYSKAAHIKVTLIYKLQRHVDSIYWRAKQQHW